MKREDQNNQTNPILESLNIKNPVLIGKGGQVWVFNYKPGIVVKIYRKAKRDYLESLAKLEKRITTRGLPFSITEILEINENNGTYFTLEKELVGKPLGDVFLSMSEQDKEKAATQYLDVINNLSKIIFEDHDYGQVLITGEELTSPTWTIFMDNKLLQRVNLVRKQLEQDVLHLEEKINLMRVVIKNKLNFDEKRLVHGDYFYNNVLFDAKNNLSAMLDFSNSTVVGDYRMDIACGIMYFDLDDTWKDFLVKLAVKDYGKEILPIIHYYTAYQAFFQTESYFYNEGLYKWCLSHLNSDNLWKFIKNSVSV